MKKLFHYHFNNLVAAQHESDDLIGLKHVVPCTDKMLEYSVKCVHMKVTAKKASTLFAVYHCFCLVLNQESMFTSFTTMCKQVLVANMTLLIMKIKLVTLMYLISLSYSGESQHGIKENYIWTQKSSCSLCNHIMTLIQVCGD